MHLGRMRDPSTKRRKDQAKRRNRSLERMGKVRQWWNESCLSRRLIRPRVRYRLETVTRHHTWGKRDTAGKT